MSPIYQNEWASIARMLIALQRDLRTTLFPREVGVVDGFMLEALLLRIYLWQLEGTAVTVSMLSRSLGVSRATCRRKLAVCRQSISDSWLGNLRECLAHLVKGSGCDCLLMQAASLLDGFSFDLFPPFENGLAAPEVD